MNSGDNDQGGNLPNQALGAVKRLVSDVIRRNGMMEEWKSG